MAAMIRLGLTGGIGMGKSTAAELLAKHGAKISDSDMIARELAEPGQPALQAIAEAFGNEVLRADGSLDRGRVAKLVFGDDAARRALEDILHPRIRATWLGNLDRWAGEGVARAPNVKNHPRLRGWARGMLRHAHACRQGEPLDHSRGAF